MAHKLEMRVYKQTNDCVESAGDRRVADQILEAALDGNLRRIIKLGKELDDGRGMAETIGSIRGCDGEGVLHCAAEGGRINLCKYLVEELKLPLEEKNSEGFTPLLLTTRDGHLSTMQYLVENGADLAVTNNCNSTALHFSASKGHTGMIRYLLSKGLDVNVLNAFGTPLELAAMYCKRDALKYLLDHGANAGADPNGISCGNTPLSFAASQGAINVIKFLLGAGADPNISNYIGLKPIEKAASEGNLRAVKILFPVTAPIPTYSNWSISGIMEHVKSEDFTNQAIVEDPSDATVLSSRSLCFACHGDGNNALADAEASLRLRPDWAEAYYRKGVALTILGELDMATDAFLVGLKKDPENKELRHGFREAVEAKFNSFDI